MVQAIGGCTCIVISRAIVRDIHPQDKAASMIGYVNMAWALAPRGITRVSAYPLLPGLGMRWARSRPWEGLRVAVNAHLTTLTAAGSPYTVGGDLTVGSGVTLTLEPVIPS